MKEATKKTCKVPGCYFTYTNKYQKHRHKKTHSKDQIAAYIFNKKIECPVCQKRFKDKNVLRVHKYSHAKEGGVYT